MKKIKKIMFILILTIILTGCSTKTEYSMEIKEDKSMDFSIIMAMDDELIEGMLSMGDVSESEEETTENPEAETENTEESEEVSKYTEEEKWAFVESSFSGESTDDSDTTKTDLEKFGFKKEKYEVDKYKGFKYTKKIKNIDDISGSKPDFKLEEYEKISDKVVFEKKGNKYKANFSLKNENDETTEGAEITYDTTFNVVLPVESISNNADKVSEDGKTLTWVLNDENTKNIEFEFELGTDILLIVSIVVFAIGLLSVILVIIKNKKTKQPEPVVNTEEELETI